MNKLKEFIKTVLHTLFDSRYEKAVIIALPLLAVMLSAMIIAPSLTDIIHYTKVDAQTPDTDALLQTSSAMHLDTAGSRCSPSPEESAVNTPSVSVTPTPIPVINNADNKSVYLTGTSVESDLYVFVRGKDGYPVQGEVFKLDVTYPSGQTASYDTKTDGSCYLVNLPSGNYKVSMQNKDGYNTPAVITCNVSEKVSFTRIENIEEIVEVKDVSEVQSEVKTNENVAPIEIVPEVIVTPAENNVVYSDSPILDPNGYVTYTYSYETINNHLILADGTESDVIPIEEGGVLMFGMKTDADTGISYTVDLFNPDNTPLDIYQITATPIMQEQNVTGGWQNRDGYVCYINNDGSMAVGLKSIDGKLYYFDCYGRKASQIGVDVSFYNGTVNWQAVKNSGVDFVIIRVGGRGWSTGLLYDDSCFYNYLHGAASAGLKVGVYFYSTAVNRVEAVQEASVVLDRLNGLPLDFPIFIDTEYSGDYPRGRSDTISVAQRVEVVQAFCQTVNSENYRAGVYSSENFFKNCLDYASVSQYCIWIASYTENNQLPSFNARYDIWQFTDRARVSGINGNCDVSVIF